jgi:hypothetical protein
MAGMKLVGIVNKVGGVERLNSTTDIRAKAVVCGLGGAKASQDGTLYRFVLRRP